MKITLTIQTVLHDAFLNGSFVMFQKKSFEMFSYIIGGKILTRKISHERDCRE